MDKASRKKSQSTGRASNLEKDGSTSSTRRSLISTTPQSSSSTGRAGAKPDLPPVLQQVVEAHKHSAILDANPSGSIEAWSNSTPESAIDHLEEGDEFHTDELVDDIPDPEDNSPAREHASEVANSQADVNAHPLPDSKEGLGLNTLRSSVDERSSLLSLQRKQIYEDGMAFYEYLSSLMPASLERAEILTARWNELWPATTVYVNQLLEIEDDKKTIEIRERELYHPAKHKHASKIADEHQQSEIGAKAKTSITVSHDVGESDFTAEFIEDEDGTLQSLRNDIDGVRDRIDEIYSESYRLKSGLEGNDLENLDLSDEQREQIRENNSLVGQLELQRRNLEGELYQRKGQIAAVRAAA